MKRKNKKILAALFASATAAFAGMAPASPVQKAPLRLVPRADFCASLAGTFARYADENGYDRLQGALLVTAGVAALVSEAKDGHAQAYVSANALAALSNVPRKTPVDGLVPLSNLFGPALAVRSDATIVNGVEELRFVPFAQRGMDVIVLARSIGSLSDEHALKVATAARDGGVRISVVWLGTTPSEQEDAAAGGEARVLAWLAASTGGGFSDLSGRGNPCLQPL